MRLLSASVEERAPQKVERFLENARVMSIDTRILRQKVPQLLLQLAEEASHESGPVVNKVLEELSDDRLNFTARIYALVSASVRTFF